MANDRRQQQRNQPTPDTFFDVGDDNDVVPNLKKRQFLASATSWLKRDEKKAETTTDMVSAPFTPPPPSDNSAAWLNRDDQTGHITTSAGQPGAYTTNSTHSGLLRISGPVPFHDHEFDGAQSVNGRTKSSSPPRMLGMGAEVVRTPMEALDGLRSPTEPARERSTSLSRSSRTRSSPHLKQRSHSNLPPIPSSPPLRPSFKTSSTAPAPAAELPPLPAFRPISTFEAARSSLPSPPKTASPTKFFTSQKLSTEPAALEPPLTASTTTSFVLPPPPFVPVLVNAPPSNPESIAADQQLIALETASSTLTTTLATLTATPSHISAYLEPLFAARNASPRRSTPARELSRPSTPKSPFTAAFAAHQQSLGLFGGRPSSPMSIYPAESEDDDDYKSDDDLELAARIALPPSALISAREIEEELSTPSSKSSTTPTASHPRSSTSPSVVAPLKVPMRRTHVFLDRPSAPYAHILAFLRSLASTTTPILPRSLAQMPASSAVRMDALIEVRDEATYLGMELLVGVCEDEIVRRRGDRARKMSSGVLKVKEPKAVTVQDRHSVSSGHETAVEDQTGSGSSRPGSLWDTNANAKNESFMMPPINTVSAHRSAPVPVVAPPTSFHHASSASLSSPISPSALNGKASQLRSSLSNKTSSSTVRPSQPPTILSFSHTPGHSRFPQSVESFASSLGADADVESEMGVLAMDVKPKPGQLASRRERSQSRSQTTTRGRAGSDMKI